MVQRETEVMMAHRYGHPITVVDAEEGPTGQPLRAFGWRGTVYRVVEVLSHWHLRDRWWQADGSSAPDEPGMRGMLGASDRTYYRVRCAPALVCDIYHDATAGAWVLDCVCD